MSETAAAMAADTRTAVNFRLLFESAPVLFLVLDPDLRIVAASDAYLRATMTTREGIVGRHILVAFPDNPDDPEATGTANVNASLQRVLKLRLPDTLAVQKYDVERSPDAGGGFETRYWSPRHTPIVGPDDQLAYIVQQVEDVTALVTLQEDGEDARQQTDDLRERTRQMQAEILRRSQELQDANQALRAADNAKNDCPGSATNCARRSTRFWASANCCPSARSTKSTRNGPA